MMNTNTNFAAISTSAASVRSACASLHNVALASVRASGCLASVAMSADVQTAALSAAVAAKVISPDVAADLSADVVSALPVTLSILTGFISVTVKGTQKENNLRRFYNVKGAGATKKAVLTGFKATFEVKGDMLTVPVATVKKERTAPRPLTDDEKIKKYEYEILKIRARMEHTAAHKSEEFKFPTFKEWLAASAEVKAE